RFPLGEIEVEIVAADGIVGNSPIAGANDDNERSIAVLVTFAGRRLLVTGDLTGGGESTADLETPLAAITGPVDVLRTGHHGSKTSSNEAALSTWSPTIAIISAGTDNPYCHPVEEVLMRIAAHAGEVLVTGAGIVDDGDRCGGPTIAPANVFLGMGNIEIGITVAGDLFHAAKEL
ncbi:MAG: ComEC/Rec2 family competence protein, partial [Myxococcota bacterium]